MRRVLQNLVLFGLLSAVSCEDEDLDSYELDPNEFPDDAGDAVDDDNVDVGAEGDEGPLGPPMEGGFFDETLDRLQNEAKTLSSKTGNRGNNAYVKKMFFDEDQDGNMALDAKEFDTLMAKLGKMADKPMPTALSQEDADRRRGMLLKHFDMDKDGFVSYVEFTSSDVQRKPDLFTVFDVNNDRTIDREELSAFFEGNMMDESQNKKRGKSKKNEEAAEENARQVIKQFDQDGDGALNDEEFSNLETIFTRKKMYDTTARPDLPDTDLDENEGEEGTDGEQKTKKKYKKKKKKGGKKADEGDLASAFFVMDSDGSGFLDMFELAEFLKKDPNDEFVITLRNIYDKDGDDLINMGEFYELLKSANSKKQNKRGATKEKYRNKLKHMKGEL